MEADLHRALVVDELEWWLEGVALVLAEVGIEVVAKLTLPSAGLAALPELRPGLLVTSIDAPPPEPNMTSYLGQALELIPELRVVAVSRCEDRRHVENALTAGAAAYVTRRARPEDLATAIRHAHRPSVYLPFGAKPLRQEDDEQPPGRRLLTQRELEILRLAAQGYSNAELARILWITEQTVKFHLSNVYRKLGVVNRTEASRWVSLQGPPSCPRRTETPAGAATNHRAPRSAGTSDE